MGPADHIRTKHEVKAFVESGDATFAEGLLKHSSERRIENQSYGVAEKLSQRHGQSITKKGGCIKSVIYLKYLTSFAFWLAEQWFGTLTFFGRLVG
jgi:hypothetical protein